MGTLKIKDRKNTTDKGLKELKKLAEKIGENLSADVEKIESDLFWCRTEHDNGLQYSDFNYKEWFENEAYWRIEDGFLRLFSFRGFDQGQALEILRIEDILRIDFENCMSQLEILLEKYNELAEKKDKEIEKFLNFCKTYLQE